MIMETKNFIDEVCATIMDNDSAIEVIVLELALSIIVILGLSAVVNGNFEGNIITFLAILAKVIIYTICDKYLIG